MSPRQFLIVLAIASACGKKQDEPLAVGSSDQELVNARPIAPAASDDGQWTMPAKDYASTRFSGLREIDTTNVANLRVAWTFSTGESHGHEAAPLVVGDTMFVVTPFPNKLFALDLAHQGALKWSYDPKPAPAAQGVACCDTVNRGAAYDGGAIFYATLDDNLVSVDAETGKENWKTQLGDIAKGETITAAPLVVKGKVLIGNAGGEMGVRGWLTAVDEKTGEVAWRAYATGPDKDVLIGPDFHPFYPQDRGTDLGVTTWPPDKWKVGGGNSWGWISYDPALDLVYYGTGNPGTWNPEMRPGDNKWTCGIFARRPETGQAAWFYQWSPHDLWDHDGVNESILVDLDVGGKTRHVLIHPERNGYVYVMDRETGEVLSADPFAPVNATKGVDLKTGRLIVNPDKVTTVGKTVRDICPHAGGAKDWQPSAWDPDTALLYIPHQNLCMDEQALETSYIAGTPYVGADVKMYAGPGGNRGAFTAWDPIARKPAWEIKEDLPVWSGALATAGGLVFYGTLDGWFKALDARTGQLLWQFKTPSGIIGQPITYRGPDGKQYIAILSGVGGWAGAIVTNNLDPHDQTAALGFANATSDLPNRTTKGGTLFVFSL